MTLTDAPAPLASPSAASPYAPPRPYTPLSGGRKIRVLLISHTCQSRTEGQPKAHALASLPDVDLHLLTPARWMHYGQWRDAQPPVNPAFACTIAPVRLPWVGPAQYFLHHYPQLPALLRSFKPDVIDLWEEPWGYVSAQACRLRNRLLPAAKIVSETEQNIFKKLPFPFERFRSYTLRQADYAVARNREAVDVIRAKGYTGPAEVVPNAVDTGLFKPLPPADRATARKSLGFTGFVAGYVGRLVPEKGLMDLLEALPHCPPAVQLMFLGTGPFEPDLRRRAAEFDPAGKRVLFFPGRPLAELPEVMNALDVFVLPSRTTARWKEQFGRVIIEAHACGTPVIGTTSGAIPDVIADAGLAVPENDPRALAQAITQLFHNPDQAREFGQRGLHNAHAFFTWRRVAERMATIYQTVTNFREK
jgi:glycosyltransferase involved in cell wall biosynthesis